MKKISVLIIVGVLLFTGLGVSGYNADNESDITHFDKITTPAIKIQSSEKQEYITLQLSGINTYQTNPGQPRLPKIVDTVELPFGATDISVRLTPQKISTKTIEYEIQPATALLPLSPEYVSLYSNAQVKDEQVYAMTTPYPETWYTTTISCGINEKNQHVTYLTIQYYPIRYTPSSGVLHIAETADISISYRQPEHTPFPQTASFDLVIIAPSSFSQELQPLIEHKNNLGITTFLKTTEEIYDEYSGVDKPAQIKNFIKDAIETEGITSVLLVGGLNNVYFAKPRDDANQGSSAWYVPVRYTNLWDNPKFPLDGESSIHDPGVISDLYYADIYREGGAFSEWDVNGDGIFAAWGVPGIENDTGIDLYPDVALGRLACRSVDEVNTVVNKIINYETTTYGAEWFEKMIVVSGDGFLDQQDLNIQWDTNEVPDGQYVIKAQSSNPSNEHGPILTVNVTKDSTQESVITYSHDDHLNPAIQDAFENGFPTVPIAEIVSVSEGDILGNTDVAFEPTSNAYCNEFYFWANVSYVDGILTIRGKSYDPKPYGNVSSIHVWVEDDQGDVVFSDWRNNTEMYYEGEWVTGEKELLGRGGALHYMPEEFDKEICWCSNGKFNGPDDVINSFSEGYGFAFFSGHGSPGYWGDQYPGIPGNRRYGSVDGLTVSNLRSYPPFATKPIWPMKELSNTGKLPITVVGGCHNSLFNVSLIPSAIQYYTMLLGRNNWMWTYIQAVPQCWSWYMVQLPNTGSIATMGNTGLGWGWEAEFCTVGAGDGWITSEFFRQYGEHYGQEGYKTLGQVYQQTQTSYVNTFKDFTLPECWWFPDLGWDAVDAQAVEQWVLLGDPSLQIGGYE